MCNVTHRQIVLPDTRAILAIIVTCVTLGRIKTETVALRVQWDSTVQPLVRLHVRLARWDNIRIRLDNQVVKRVLRV